ncbi:MAG: bifunctional 4-hydroxy-3-methylbut-2-enyl diphosphate reductase/30S ribosomal protein S1 [Oscillospiraceae bacterium]|nr:bifunctional 4-hydroxy-3-methylbut-2-enyl diphosphate reductase/30S ribosomal protein S1 [Oscillospiraceae bacterium]
MQITLSETAGFCFGVRRAVELVERTAGAGERVVTLGPIVHNRHVVERFAHLGVREAAEVEEIPDGATVIIRAHGVGRAVYEALQARGLRVVDATCPFVERIHQLVRKAGTEGRKQMIFGSRTHPEVVGISGWCDEPLVVETPKELETWLLAEPKRREMPLILVAQTTSNQNLWKKVCKIANSLCTNCKIFDTICEATENRQTAAAALAAKSDAMVVVGDRTSSNTRQLAAICAAHCPRVFAVDNAAELADCDFSGIHTIGITAGASTPAWIIKEVNQTMDEKKTVDTAATEESFEALLDASIKTLNTGDTVTGTVVAIGTTEVQVDLGTKHAGYIPCDEVSADPNVKPEEVLHVGDEIKVFVVRVNDQEGTVQLSRKKLDGMRVWDELQEAADNKTPVEAKITETNKGGLVANVKGVRVFIPASASGIARGGDLEALKGQTVRIRITEVNRERRGGRVVGSIRAVASEERKAAQEKIWSEIEIGKKYTGVVKSLTSYGAFVDIGGVDGMVHVSELSWRRIKNPAEVVKVGDTIEVFVIGLDPEKHKISLGYKTAEMNPWNQFTAQFQVGDVAKVKIVKMMTFGAFAEIIPGVDGLIHISQIADRRIAKPEDVLTVGQEVDAKIIDIDAENKRISLSIRALLVSSEETDAPADEAEAVEAQ